MERLKDGSGAGRIGVRIPAVMLTSEGRAEAAQAFADIEPVWIPAFAGMTIWGVRARGLVI